MIRPPVPWFGGKYYLARRIINEFPDHRHYVEPFGGGGSVLLNKPPAPIETYNDIDSQVTTMFRVLRDHGRAFRNRILLTPYSEAEFERARRTTPKSDIDKAVSTFVRMRQSFSGTGQSWSFEKHRSSSGMASGVNAWWSAIDTLPTIINRLRRVQITCRPACDVIRKFDHPDTLIYCDPPYVHSTRTEASRNVYAKEMSDDEHRALAKVLHECTSKVVLSGYPSKLYRELYGDWRIKRFRISQRAGTSKVKRRVTECLWMNF